MVLGLKSCSVGGGPEAGLELPDLSAVKLRFRTRPRPPTSPWIWPAEGVFTSGFGWRWGRIATRASDNCQPTSVTVLLVSPRSWPARSKAASVYAGGMANTGPAISLRSISMMMAAKLSTTATNSRVTGPSRPDLVCFRAPRIRGRWAKYGRKHGGPPFHF